MALGKRVKISVVVQCPVPATDEQVQQWVKFNLHCLGSIEHSNPLADFDMEGVSSSSVIVENE